MNFKKIFSISSLMVALSLSCNYANAVDSIPKDISIKDNNRCFIGLTREQLKKQLYNSEIKDFLIDVLKDRNTTKLQSNNITTNIKFECKGSYYTLILSNNYIFSWSRLKDGDRFGEFRNLLDNIKLDDSIKIDKKEIKRSTSFSSNRNLNRKTSYNFDAGMHAADFASDRKK